MAIPSQPEITAALYGALRLARLDRSGLNFFDRSYDGFWKSFFAAAIAAPAHFGLLYFTGATDMGFGRLLAEAMVYAVSWLAFPLVMIYVAEMLSRSDRYYDYMVPYNWAGVWQIAVFLFVTVLSVAGLLPAGVASFVTIAAFLAILAYQWYIARVGLEISGGAAAAVVFADLVVGLLVRGIGGIGG